MELVFFPSVHTHQYVPAHAHLVSASPPSPPSPPQSILGGVARVSWGDRGSYLRDPTASLFTIEEGRTCVVYPLAVGKEQYALQGCAAFGPLFGGYVRG